MERQPAYPQAQGDLPRVAATLLATAICWASVARSGREAYARPPPLAQVPRSNCSPP